MSKKRNVSQSEARKILWHQGILRWKCHGLQQKIYDQFYSTDNHITTMLIGRQTGKSYFMCLLAVETCLRNPNVIVKYACPKQKMVKTILKPIMRTILEDCPEELRPEYKEADKLYVFKNGSEIQMAGCDNQNYDNIRGGRSHLWIVDEAGFCDELNTVVRSVLIPTTTTTNGKGILASTPDPENSEHEFIKEFVEPAELNGTLFKYTIDDNPLITDEQKKKIEQTYPGGRNNPRFRAEFLVEIVRNAESMVIPEFDTDAEKEVINDWKRPSYFDIYLSMDIGGKDFTAILFGYYDFLKATVVIEDEILIKEKRNSKAIASMINDKHELLYGEKPAYMRWADNNNIQMLTDMKELHNIQFFATEKHNREAAINLIKNKILDRTIIINPRCKNLIYQLKHCRWKKSSQVTSYKEFARSADGGHFDLVAALIYFVRNVIYTKSPYPKGYGSLNSESAYIRDGENNPHTQTKYTGLKNAFKVKKSLKY